MNEYRVMIKLTDADGYTRRGQPGETHWEAGCTREPTGVGDQPCGAGVIHAYASALQAALCDPIHGDYGQTARAYAIVAPTRDQWQTDGLKCWTTQAVTLGETVSVPAITLVQRIAWALCLAPQASTRDWAIAWLTGQDRSAGAAEATAWGVAWAAWGAAARAPRGAAARAAWWDQVAVPAWERAQAILAGTYPADQYDAPWEHPRHA